MTPKFRAVVKEDGCVFPVIMINFLEEFVNIRQAGGYLQTYRFSEIELLQYTGLKDMNGKEIYEGDICKSLHDFGPGGWAERTFTVRWDDEKGYQWNYWDMSVIEVIGNRYENPELLEAK